MLGHRIVEEKLALRFEHERCPAVEVLLEPWAFVVRSPRREARFSPCDTETLVTYVVAELERERRSGVRPLPLWFVAGQLLALRERGLADVNPAIARVLQATLSVSRRAPRLAGRRALYHEEFLVRDVVQHRAAAIALAFFDRRLVVTWLDRTGAGRPVDDAGHVEILRDWRGLFSPDGRSYRTLDRTLMNLPRGVPPELVCELARVRLERPPTGRAALTALLLLVGDRRFRRHPDFAGHATILQRAGEEDVAEACAILAEHLQRRLDTARTRDLRVLTTFLLDYPARFQGTLPGLVRRVIRWHAQRAMLAARAAARDAAVGAEPAWGEPVPHVAAPVPWRSRGGGRLGQAQRPSIPLPGIEGVTFLATAARIRAEGHRMDHCIADYVRDAVEGQCFLFHVVRNGSEASVEVDRQGRVRQASGPSNVDNEAARWGTRVLREWGRGLRSCDPAAGPPSLRDAALEAGQLCLDLGPPPGRGA